LRLSRLICALGLCCLLLQACADTAERERAVYVVRPQDTLYSIAWRYGLDFRDLARWNNIGPDFRITVGQTLVVTPDSRAAPAVRRASAPPKAPARSTPAPPTATGPTATGPTGTGPTAATGPTASTAPMTRSAPGWSWPTDRSGAPRPVPSGGVLLSGHVGQDIRAAAAGRVVYNGSGIRGYGNLIIIKHGENLLSAYAHNRDSLVHDGQQVALGEVIGHMGEGAPQKPVLYFEIRRDGKPINPLRFLPDMK
jgi:lipoprotein NlpD